MVKAIQEQQVIIEKQQQQINKVLNDVQQLKGSKIIPKTTIYQ
jgi:hypothetical protein